MTFRPYTGKVRLGNSETFLSISDFSQLPDGYVLSRVGSEIVATRVGQDRLDLDAPVNPNDAATKAYVDALIIDIDAGGNPGQVQLDNDAAYFVDSDGYSHRIMPDGLLELTGTNIVLDLDPALPPSRLLDMTGDVTFSTANLGPGRGMSLRLAAGNSQRTVTFPNDGGVPTWNWLGGAPPSSIPANKIAILSVVSYGYDDEDVVAGWSYTDSSSISGGGDAGQVAFFNGNRLVTGESGLQWDNVNDRLVVGSVETPAANLHVAGTAQIEENAVFGAYISVAGGLEVDGYSIFDGTSTFTGTVSFNDNVVTDVGLPVSNTDAANKQYVENRRLLVIQNIAADGYINDDTDMVFVGGSGNVTVNLPLAQASNEGKVITIKKISSGSADNVETAASSGQTIDGSLADESGTPYKIYLQNETVSLISNGLDWYVI